MKKKTITIIIALAVTFSPLLIVISPPDSIIRDTRVETLGVGSVEILGTALT